MLLKSQAFVHAKTIFEEMLRKGMADEAVFTNLALIANAKEDYAAEVQAYSNAILCNPRNGNLYYQRALAYVNLAKIPESCYDWNIAKKLNRQLRDETLDYFCESYAASLTTSQAVPDSETPSAN